MGFSLLLECHSCIRENVFMFRSIWCMRRASICSIIISTSTSNNDYIISSTSTSSDTTNTTNEITPASAPATATAATQPAAGHSSIVGDNALR